MKSGKNVTYLREINQKNILNIIRQGAASRSMIARKTGLTKPAVSDIVENLMDAGFVQEIGRDDITRGRRPELLSLKKGTHYAVGVDISRSGCAVGFCDFCGEVLDAFEVDIKDLPPVLAIKKICAEINAGLSECSLDTSDMLGIGVSVPGPVTSTGEILSPPNFDAWHNFNIIDHFSKEIDTLICVEDAPISFALAENLYGYGMDYKHYFMLEVANGVGSALINDGIPYRGLYGLNPVFGHTSIDFNGPECRCGGRGCLELYASVPRMVEAARKQGIHAETWNDIVDLALDRDPRAIDIVKSQAKYLSIAISNIATSFAPEAVVLSGAIQYKPDLLLNFIRSDFFNKVTSKAMPIPKILVSELLENRLVIAACAIIHSRYFY